jgi:hypothetical protein
MLTKRSLFWHFLNFFEVRTKPELRRTYDKYISQQQSKIWRILKYKSKKKVGYYPHCDKRNGTAFSSFINIWL